MVNTKDSVPPRSLQNSVLDLQRINSSTSVTNHQDDTEGAQRWEVKKMIVLVKAHHDVVRILSNRHKKQETSHNITGMFK